MDCPERTCRVIVPGEEVLSLSLSHSLSLILSHPLTFSHTFSLSLYLSLSIFLSLSLFLISCLSFSLILALLHLQDEGVGGGRRGEDEEPAIHHQPSDLEIHPRLG